VKNNGIKPLYGRLEVVLPEYLKNVTENPVKIIYLNPGEEKRYTFYVLLTRYDHLKGWEPEDPSVLPQNKKIPITVKLQSIPSYNLIDTIQSEIEFRLGPIFEIREFDLEFRQYVSFWVKGDIPDFPYDGDGDNELEAAESHHFNFYFVNVGDEPANITYLTYFEVIPCNSSKYITNPDLATGLNYIQNSVSYYSYMAEANYSFPEPAEYYAPNTAHPWLTSPVKSPLSGMV